MTPDPVTARIHHLPGRLRVRLPVTRRDAQRAGLVKADLLGLPGVNDVRVSTLTGSVLVHYDIALANPGRIDDMLRRHGLPSGCRLPSRIAPPDALAGPGRANVASMFAEAALEAVVKRCAVAVIAALV